MSASLLSNQNEPPTPAAAFIEEVIAAVDDTLDAAGRNILAVVAARAAGDPSAPRPEQSDPVLEEHYEHARSLRQAEIDFLIRKQAVPAQALCRDGDGDGWPLSAARVIFYKNGSRFDYAEEGNEGAVSAIVTVLRDRDDYVHDILAWAPRTGMLGTRFGRAVLIGEQEIDTARFDCSLVVHRDIVEWLRANRTGVMILDKKNAWRLLHDLDVAAQDFEHGNELKKVLAPPSARIVIPALEDA